jgi:hypothetical protein
MWFVENMDEGIIQHYDAEKAKNTPGFLESDQSVFFVKAFQCVCVSIDLNQKQGSPFF